MTSRSTCRTLRCATASALLMVGLAAQQASHQIRSGGTGPAANPNPSPRGMRWTYPTQSGLSWYTESVSCGWHGAHAWLGQRGDRLSLVATTDAPPASGPPTPIYEAPIANLLYLGLSAADKADGCAVSVITSNASPELRFYRSSSATPLFAYPIAVSPAGSYFRVKCCDDGSRASVGYTDPANQATVAVYDPGSNPPGALVRTFQVPSQWYREHDLSAAGNVVLLATTSAYLLDVATGTELFRTSAVSCQGYVVDEAGDTFAHGGVNVGAGKRNGSTYNRILTFTDPTMLNGTYAVCDLSADGSTLAVAAIDTWLFGTQRLGVYCWRLSAAGSTLLWSFGQTSWGSLTDTPSRLSISDDGKWIAVGSWGLEGNQHPEFWLFDRDAGNEIDNWILLAITP